jgi:hypothetical protein
VTSLTINIQGAPDNHGSPGAYATFATASTFPNGKLNFTSKTNYYPWVRVNVSAIGAPGSIMGILNGFRENSNTIGGGGGSSAGGYDLIEVNGTPLATETTLNFINGTSSTPVCTDVPGTSTNCTFNVSGGGTVVHAFGASFGGNGSALTPNTVYTTIPYACTIQAWNITVDAGTATVDLWKIATGTAVPTIANTITAAALPAISSGTAIHSTTLTGWTTSVTANDILGVNLKVVSGATYLNIVVQCQ